MRRSRTNNGEGAGGYGCVVESNHRGTGDEVFCPGSSASARTLIVPLHVMLIIVGPFGEQAGAEESAVAVCQNQVYGSFFARMSHGLCLKYWSA